MITFSNKNKSRFSFLFNNHKWKHTADAILEGGMGEVLVDDEDNPHFVVLTLPKLKFFILGGDAAHPGARAYLKSLRFLSMMICTTPELENLVKEIYQGRYVEQKRYSFTSESLDLGHLRTLVAKLPESYQIKPIDLPLAEKITAEKSNFTSTHLINFSSPRDFIERGFGFCILQGDEIVCLASTFTVSEKGIEIQIDTRDKHQGRGLATVAGAQLAIHALEQGLDPNWDAANEKSSRLAQKLGYTPQDTYPMFVYVKFRALIWLRSGLRAIRTFQQR